MGMEHITYSYFFTILLILYENLCSAFANKLMGWKYHFDEQTN